MKRFALAGNPNCGKTTLFNSLTGSTAHVGNWPGVTVDKREGLYKKLDEPISIIDLPGIYSLSPYTPEEVISRQYILDEKPDLIINIVDATNLERNLYLTTQLMETDTPMVIALNMMDIVKKNNESIDVNKMQEVLKIPVVEISALKEDNIDELMKVAYKACLDKRQADSVVYHSEIKELIEQCKSEYEIIHIENPLFHAIKLIELDELEVKKYPELVKVVTDYKKDDEDYEALIADARYKFIANNLGKVKTSSNETNEETSKNPDKLTKSDKVDKVLTNRWLGIPIFLLILFLIFHLTFSGNFLFLGGLFNDSTPTCLDGTIFEELFWTADGINSPGVILQSFVINVTDWLSEIIGGLISGIKGCPEWVEGFICNGILAGLFSVLSFLPQILLLFLFFSILEDTGYMARIAFILDRIFRKFGLSGRAFMPMIMGFGCSVPAMINTRTLADENERVATIRVIPFFSCGAKLPILTAIAGAIATMAKVGHEDLITLSMYVLGMVVAICAVIFMRNTSMKGETPPFIMELPAYHFPQFKSLMYHLWDKLKHFVKKAFTIILASTILIWFLSHFTWSWGYLEDADMDQSILSSLGQLLQPLFTPLGFGSQLKAFGWVFVVAAVTGLIAKENIIDTFGVLAACAVIGFSPNEDLNGVDSVIELIKVTSITNQALISFIAFNMLTIPCFAACATAKAELPKNKFWSTILFWIITSYFVASMIYVVGTWPWTCSIYIVLLIAIIVGIYLYNRCKKKEEKCNRLK